MLARDIRLALRKRGQLVQPLRFFAIVTTLFSARHFPRNCRGCATLPRVCCGSRPCYPSLLALEFLFRR